MKAIILMILVLLSVPAFAINIPEGFKQEQVKVNGINMNVYKGGQGEPLLLIHGYAQSALMWVPAMEKFKDRYTVIVPDIRGAGLTDAPETGYDKITMAEDMKLLLDHYQISQAKVVGHDIGLMVAYTLAAKYPKMVTKLALMDAFLPGIGPGEKIYNDPNIWHFRFHGPYAEKLVQGREYIYFDSLWTGFSARPGSFPEDHKKYYSEQYARPGRVKAGFSYFTAFPNDAVENKKFAKTKLAMPVLALGGERANGKGLIDTMKVASKKMEGKIVQGCGHWMLEECPAETLNALDSFLNTSGKNNQVSGL